MAQINQSLREVTLKIVYCGPALSGKTTNLEMAQRLVESDQKSHLAQISTAGDRTLFFDFMAVHATHRDFKFRFQMFTVPGQPVYATTRQTVLRGADGIVFVLDSAWDRMEANSESIRETHQMLQADKVRGVPAVYQFNKRDLPTAAPVEYMDYAFNSGPMKLPTFGATAVRGDGVLDSLNAISRLLMLPLLRIGAQRPVRALTPMRPPAAAA